MDFDELAAQSPDAGHFMIVDCHTHIWQSPDQLGQLDLGELPKVKRRRAPGRAGARGGGVAGGGMPSADADHHYAMSSAVDLSIVLGFKSRYLRAEIPNRYVA